jgi:hypothetical protein
MLALWAARLATGRLFRSMLGGIFEVGANQIDMADAQRQDSS